jgi:3-deoxy-manno-octulosonate cytidylyltransferase (CMP-KDO synthetase)
MNPLVLIPARLAATRLPGKPLLDIGGQSLIERVLARALETRIGPVAVAAGDAEIVRRIEARGGRAVLTDPDLPSGTDRVRAALEILDPEGRFDVVINLQGDIPFFDGALLAQTTALLSRRPSCDIATAATPETDPGERDNPDLPKAILALEPDARSGRALYFTRSRLFGEGPVLRHIGVYAYRRAALERFTGAPPSPLERREKLEQLRALELGLEIWCAVVEEAPVEVNTPADLAAARLVAAGRRA